MRPARDAHAAELFVDGAEEDSGCAGGGSGAVVFLEDVIALEIYC